MGSGLWDLGYLIGTPFRTAWDRRRMDRFRDERLRRLVRHAAETIPFYSELLRKAGVDPASISGFADRERLPIVTRGDLRDAGEEAWARDVSASRRVIASTSGSSGNPLVLLYRPSDRFRKHAINLHCMWLYGWRPWHRAMALGSQALPRGTVIQRLGLCRWTWVDPSRPVGEWLDAYLRLRPQALHSYPSALREFCIEAKARGGLAWKPRVLSVGGELCPAELMPLAEEVFGAPPLVMYGAMEGGRMAFQCCERRGLHVRIDAVDIEILSEGRPAAAGEEGEVVMTSLINTGMPFIRYRLGDVAAWEDGDCPCGLWWPRITLHQGRGSDVLALSDGRRVPITRLGAIVGKSASVRQFQFVQTGPDSLLLRYESDIEPCESVNAVIRELRAVLPGVSIAAEQAAHIPRTATGKVARFIKKAG